MVPGAECFQLGQMRSVEAEDPHIALRRRARSRFAPRGRALAESLELMPQVWLLGVGDSGPRETL